MSTRQPHRKRIKHFHVAGHFHELTFSCYRCNPLLTNDAWRERLARCIETASEEKGFVLNVNPVKRGLCKHAVDWKWSSARFYVDQVVDLSLPRLSRPPADLFAEGGVQFAHQA